MTIEPTFERAWPLDRCWGRHAYWMERCRLALGHEGDHEIYPLGVRTSWQQSARERWLAQRHEWEYA